MSRGRDGNGDGVQQYRHGWIPISANYSHPQRSSPAEWADQVDTLNNLPSIEDGESSDTKLAHVWRTQGFDGTPEVLTPDEFASLPDSYTRIYRGIGGADSDQWAEEFRSGPAFAGLGVHGNGTYTAAGREVADEYTGLDSSGGALLSMALRPEARVATPLQVWEEWDRLAKRDGVPPTVQSALEGDTGKMAAALGFDAVVIDNEDTGGDGIYYIIQNRTAVVVEAAAEPSRPQRITDYDDGYYSPDAFGSQVSLDAYNFG